MARQHRSYDPECFDWARHCVELFREHFQEMIRNEDDILLVAVDTEDRPVGYLVGLCRDAAEIFSIRRRGRINDLYVQEEHRGKGLGRRLMQAGMAELKQRGAEEVDLQVAGNNEKALAFYESLGLRNVAVRMYKRL